MGQQERLNSDDYYEVLGVPRGASHDVLKSAFRFKAKTEHPDVSAAPDANERFQKLNAAFEQLEKAAAQTSQTSPPTAGGAGRAGVFENSGPLESQKRTRGLVTLHCLALLVYRVRAPHAHSCM